MRFHQNIPGIKKGSILKISDVDKSRNVWAELSDGKVVSWI